MNAMSPRPRMRSVSSFKNCSAFCGNEDGGYIAAVEAIFKILFQKLICCGYEDSTDFLQGKYCQPEMIIPS